MGYRGRRGGGGASSYVVATRTSPCLALANSSIPYVLWGEDSLCFAFDVPTELFQTVYILVPGALLDDACNAIENSHLPYKLSSDDHHSLPSVVGTAYLPECRRLNCDQAYPKRILLISDRLLHFDTTDRESVQKLHLDPYPPAGVNEGDSVSVPTLPAYLDSLLSCHRELLHPKLWWWEWLWGTPEDEVKHQRERVLASHIAITTTYLLMATFHRNARLYHDVDSVAEPIKRVAEMLRMENRPDFLKKFVGVDPPRGDDPWEQEFESSEGEDADDGGEELFAMGEEEELGTAAVDEGTTA